MASGARQAGEGPGASRRCSYDTTDGAGSSAQPAHSRGRHLASRRCRAQCVDAPPGPSNANTSLPGMRSAPHVAPSMESAVDADLVEAIAQRVVELLRHDERPQPELVTAAELARRFGVDRSWVYANSARLGVVRLGTGPRARVRFDVRVVAALLASDTRPARPSSERKRRTSSTARTAQLPDGLQPLRGRREKHDRTPR